MNEKKCEFYELENVYYFEITLELWTDERPENEM